MDERLALRVDPKDTVATVMASYDKGEEITIVDKDGSSFTVTCLDSISFGHKVATVRIEKDNPILKYGERIGTAKRNIEVGEHVHTHVLDSDRGRGDLGGEE